MTRPARRVVGRRLQQIIDEAKANSTISPPLGEYWILRPVKITGKGALTIEFAPGSRLVFDDEMQDRVLMCESDDGSYLVMHNVTMVTVSKFLLGE